MSENREIQCEYSTTRSNENKCKALELEFHNCLNILEQKKCPIYKLKQQLQAKEQECEELKEKLERQKDYTITYKSYIYEEEKQLKKQLQAKEQECEKLKTQILSLQTMEIEENKKLKQECEELKEELKMNQNFVRDGSIESTALCKILEKYKQALDEIENVIKSLENENILTFPDLSLQDNVKAIMGQCNSGYKDILDIINKAKG